jgi:hypothetical protein
MVEELIPRIPQEHKVILVSPAPGVPPAYSCLKLVGPCDFPSLTLPARGREFFYASPISGEGIFGTGQIHWFYLYS